MVSEAQIRAVNKYVKANYDNITIRVSKGEREKIKQMAEAEGKSLNRFILDKIYGNK